MLIVKILCRKNIVQIFFVFTGCAKINKGLTFISILTLTTRENVMVVSPFKASSPSPGPVHRSPSPRPVSGTFDASTGLVPIAATSPAPVVPFYTPSFDTRPSPEAGKGSIAASKSYTELGRSTEGTAEKLARLARRRLADDKSVASSARETGEPLSGSACWTEPRFGGSLADTGEPLSPSRSFESAPHLGKFPGSSAMSEAAESANTGAS